MHRGLELFASSRVPRSSSEDSEDEPSEIDALIGLTVLTERVESLFPGAGPCRSAWRIYQGPEGTIDAEPRGYDPVESLYLQLDGGDELLSKAAALARLLDAKLVDVASGEQLSTEDTAFTEHLRDLLRFFSVEPELMDELEQACRDAEGAVDGGQRPASEWDDEEPTAWEWIYRLVQALSDRHYLALLDEDASPQDLGLALAALRHCAQGPKTGASVKEQEALADGELNQCLAKAGEPEGTHHDSEGYLFTLNLALAARRCGAEVALPMAPPLEQPPLAELLADADLMDCFASLEKKCESFVYCLEAVNLVLSRRGWVLLEAEAMGDDWPILLVRQAVAADLRRAAGLCGWALRRAGYPADADLVSQASARLRAFLAKPLPSRAWVYVESDEQENLELNVLFVLPTGEIALPPVHEVNATPLAMPFFAMHGAHSLRHQPWRLAVLVLDEQGARVTYRADSGNPTLSYSQRREEWERQTFGAQRVRQGRRLSGLSAEIAAVEEKLAGDLRARLGQGQRLSLFYDDDQGVRRYAVMFLTGNGQLRLALLGPALIERIESHFNELRRLTASMESTEPWEMGELSLTASGHALLVRRRYESDSPQYHQRMNRMSKQAFGTDEAVFAYLPGALDEQIEDAALYLVRLVRQRLQHPWRRAWLQLTFSGERIWVFLPYLDQSGGPVVAKLGAAEVQRFSKGAKVLSDLSGQAGKPFTAGFFSLEKERWTWTPQGNQLFSQSSCEEHREGWRRQVQGEGFLRWEPPIGEWGGWAEKSPKENEQGLKISRKASLSMPCQINSSTIPARALPVRHGDLPPGPPEQTAVLLADLASCMAFHAPGMRAWLYAEVNDQAMGRLNFYVNEHDQWIGLRLGPGKARMLFEPLAGLWRLADDNGSSLSCVEMELRPDRYSLLVRGAPADDEDYEIRRRVWERETFGSLALVSHPTLSGDVEAAEQVLRDYLEQLILAQANGQMHLYAEINPDREVRAAFYRQGKVVTFADDWRRKVEMAIGEYHEWLRRLGKPFTNLTMVIDSGAAQTQTWARESETLDGFESRRQTWETNKFTNGQPKNSLLSRIFQSFKK